MMKKVFIVLLLTVFFSCDEEKELELEDNESQEVFENKSIYDVQVGETFEIYYSTNSCCYYCISNQSKLTTVKKITEKVVKYSPSDCTGCSSTSAYVFEAIKAGTDTIKLRNMPGIETCEESDKETEMYIINVK